MTHAACSACSGLEVFPTLPCPDCIAVESGLPEGHERLIEALLRLGIVMVMAAVIGLGIVLASAGMPVIEAVSPLR